MRDTSNDPQLYTTFYDELGKRYPETALVHGVRLPGTRYWTVLHELHPFAIRRQTLLDIGCNDGVYTLPYARRGAVAVGVDISSALVEKANTAAQTGNLPARFYQADIDETAAIPGAPFDLVVCSEVLEHLRRPDQALRHIHTLLRPGGHLLLTTPTPLMEITSLSPAYLIKLIKGDKLLETQVIDSSATRIETFGVGGFLYRHDGYYPLALARYIEAFGFHCQHRYTIAFPLPSLSRLRHGPRATPALADAATPPSAEPTQPSRAFRVRLWLDRIGRRLPGLRQLGTTNIQLFQRLV